MTQSITAYPVTLQKNMARQMRMCEINPIRPKGGGGDSAPSDFEIFHCDKC